MTPAATVVITTKNRKEDLCRAIESALEQDAHPEVLVVDDGSTDGTSDLVRERYPAVRVDRAEQSAGYIVQRNRAAHLARGPVIVSIDDDAAFSTRQVVSQALADLDHPRIAAVAMPFIDVNRSPAVRQQAPDRTGRWIADSYIGTAHAIRRELFLAAGGYRAELTHQGEERDLCIRLLDRGWVVRVGRGDPIHHFESPRRDWTRLAFYGHRNNVLFAWQNVPAPMATWRMLTATLSGVALAARKGWWRATCAGLGQGWWQAARHAVARQPVSRATYRVHRQLRKRGPLLLDAVLDALPEPAVSSTSPG